MDLNTLYFLFNKTDFILFKRIDQIELEKYWLLYRFLIDICCFVVYLLKLRNTNWLMSATPSFHAIPPPIARYLSPLS